MTGAAETKMLRFGVMVRTGNEFIRSLVQGQNKRNDMRDTGYSG